MKRRGLLCASAFLASVALLNSCSDIREEVDLAIWAGCSKSFTIAFDEGQSSGSILEIIDMVPNKEEVRVRVINCTSAEGVDDAVATILMDNGYMNVVCSDLESLGSDVSLVSWQCPSHEFLAKNIASLLGISFVSEQYFDSVASTDATGRTADDQIVVSIGSDRASHLVG